MLGVERSTLNSKRLHNRLLFSSVAVIIDADAPRLSVFSVSSNLANVLRCGDAGVGAARDRACDRLSISAAHQLAPRIHRQVERSNSLRAAAGDSKDP